ncbi:hypothetical protein LXL04_004440 [Taraxacum kok-saghyz]
MQKKKILHICKVFEKKIFVFSKFFFATELVFQRFLATRSRFFEKVNGSRSGEKFFFGEKSYQLNNHRTPPALLPTPCTQFSGFPSFEPSFSEDNTKTAAQQVDGSVVPRRQQLRRLAAAMLVFVVMHPSRRGRRLLPAELGGAEKDLQRLLPAEKKTKENGREGGMKELGSFENSYITENPRTPKPLTFSKNRLRGAKNRSKTRPVAKTFSEKTIFF